MIKSLGPHRVKHGDVTRGIEDLMRGDSAHIMYSDPPWGAGNIRYWATMNKKMNGAINEPAPLEDFLGAIFGIAERYVSGFLLIEYGERWADMIKARGIAAGFADCGLVKLIYRSGKGFHPLDLHLFARPGFAYPSGFAAAVEGSYGYDTLKRAIPPLAAIVKGKVNNPIILDPCCGMGYTAQAAIDNGLAFRGNELNARRLEKTVARLERCQ